jgi:hypothetical protein
MCREFRPRLAAGAPDNETGSPPNLWRTLADRGYEPYRDNEGDIRLRNCPFHRLC